MVLLKINELLNKLSQIASDPQRLITYIIDAVLCLIVVGIFIVYLAKKKKFQALKLIGILVVSCLMIVASWIFELKVFKIVSVMVSLGFLTCLVTSLASDFRHYLENSSSSNKTQNAFSTQEEKKQVISTIVSTAAYLSARQIGALITVERNDSMDEYISKAIDIRSQLTQEIMTTIFTPGTACHDGAIIVRKNIIMCAGAFYPSTLKFDVPKSLGSRHRAAIGISEHVDALTVVVSEQTGNISITLDGVIYQNISLDSLKEMLESHLLEELQEK